MHHPDSFFIDPSYGALELRSLAQSFDTWQRGRAKPVKAPTAAKNQYSLDRLFHSMVSNGTPVELRYLHPTTVDTWVAECRAASQSEDGIASTLSSIKVFANSYVFKHLELSLADPLRKVSRITPPERDVVVLTEAELDAVLAHFKDDFVGVRNRAFVGILMGTGARLREVRELTMDRYDPLTGSLTLHGKGAGSGDRVRGATLSPRVLGYLKAYLKLRPRRGSGDLWLLRDGGTMSVWAWRTAMRRLKKVVPRVHAHLFRHTFGSYAIEHGAERAAVQDMLGHETDYMTRRYTRAARKRTASAMMPGYSPV